MHSVPRDVRRKTGAVYTPETLVGEMLEEVSEHVAPELIVDCGCGSGRFAIEAALMFPKARVYAVDISADACRMCAENARKAGVSDRIIVSNGDFLNFSLPKSRGKALWVGNPPYVRHHDIDDSSKEWLKAVSVRFGKRASGLSGLHVYFLAKIAELWKTGDFGCLITSAEWLDVNYGSFPRYLLTEILGLRMLDVRDKTKRVFEDTDSTAVVFSFSDLADKEVALKSNGVLSGAVTLNKLKKSNRWSEFFGSRVPATAEKLVPLGSIASVHRGTVTGNNKFWVRRPEDLGALPKSFSVPVVSHAREIMGDCLAQENPEMLSELIVLPENLEELKGEGKAAAKHIVEQAEREGVDKGYVASHRRPWWSIKPSDPPAIMMTYMARRPPTFVVNERGLTMLNVIHGIYPKQEMSQKAIARLADYLNESVSVYSGRTYCGGLTKFEPKEAEALLVPPLEVLER